VSADLTGQTPDVTWDEFSLQSEKIDHFEITIPLLESDKSCTLAIMASKPTYFEFNSTEGADPIEDDMMYRCYPKT
jgi:hypothetical protein